MLMLWITGVWLLGVVIFAALIYAHGEHEEACSMKPRNDTRGQAASDPRMVGLAVVAVIASLVYSEMSKEVAGLPTDTVVSIIAGVVSLAVSIAIWYLIAIALKRIQRGVFG